MIEVLDDFLSKQQCEFLINQYLQNEDKLFEVDDETYSFEGINIIKSNIEFESVIPKLKSIYYENRLRIQKLNENTNLNKNYHSHKNDYESVNNNFVIFLNDNYTGGELEFDGIESTKINPKTGRIVKFTAEEPHRVLTVVGDRFTLVGFLDNNITHGDLTIKNYII